LGSDKWLARFRIALDPELALGKTRHPIVNGIMGFSEEQNFLAHPPADRTVDCDLNRAHDATELNHIYCGVGIASIGLINGYTGAGQDLGVLLIPKGFARLHAPADYEVGVGAELLRSSVYYLGCLSGEGNQH
jgi:hypothetical protein